MRSVTTTLSILIAGLLGAAAAMAADPPAAEAPASAPAGGALSACIADFQRLCPGTPPGNGAVKTCLKDHRKELSPECKQEIRAARQKKQGA